MKNLSNVLSIILLIAVVFLFYKVFNSNESGATQSSSAFENGSEEQNSLRIAYIDMDTLKANFSYYGELNDEMEKEMESAQQYLEQRQMRFQESYELFQQMAPSMSEEELAKNQQDLMNLQQQLVSVQQDLEQELMKKENDLLGELKSEIDSVLIITKDEMNLDFVFSYQPGSPLLFANEAFEITEGVVARLNSWHTNVGTETEPGTK